MTAGPSLRVHRRTCSAPRARDREAGGRGRSRGRRPGGPAARCFPAVPAAATTRAQHRAPQLEAGRSYLWSPGIHPTPPHPDAGAPRISGWEPPGHPAGLRSNDIPDPPKSALPAASARSAGGTLPPRCPPTALVAAGGAAPGSRALRDPPGPARQQKRGQGDRPQSVARSQVELPNEPGAARAPGPPRRPLSHGV